ncbi:cell division protein ZapA [Lutispora saccharofermentans]|jgi:cell division protein ZapA|uniref:Cell division protein ZapA n=1 Tax=Lutispora saccharofermentans TaxID=3024236 RepID=A0ABT1NLL7_9FIRM|nr:cell division protein ZapA [Lutispora saccharofermentans]MCQ1531018.1 cell division protein ZapA [Lutispora saccharofermentans]
MNTRKKVVVNIFGSEYTIIGESSEDHINYIAAKVDETMRDIGSRNSKYSTTMIAVLAALNMADFLYKAQEEASVLSDENKTLKDEIAVPLEELENIRKEMDALKQQYLITQEELTKNQIELGVISKEHKNLLKENKDLKVELDVSRSALKEMQSKLFESQIDLLKAKKELDELKSFRHNKSNRNQNNISS